MHYNIWVWVWVALAAILTVAEFFTGGFYLLPFGIGAALAAALEFLAPGTIGLQWGVFGGVSSVLLVAAQRLRLARRRREGS